MTLTSCICPVGIDTQAFHPFEVVRLPQKTDTSFQVSAICHTQRSTRRTIIGNRPNKSLPHPNWEPGM